MTAAASPGLPSGVDARRYAWCRTQAVWSFGVVLPMLAEDVDGAQSAGQLGLLHYVARLIAEYCATALYLVQAFPRPLPPTSVRAIVAIRAVPDDSLRALFEDLIYDQGSQPHILAERCRQAISRTITIIGPVPQLIDRGERHRAVGHARDWLSFITQIGEGEGDYLPDVPALPNPGPGGPTRP
jgi:hypothetical protein